MALVPAAAQALDVLRFLSLQAAPVPAAVIARELGLPRSSTYHLLDTLVQRGFVVHLAEEQRFGLGLSAYELGTGYSRQAPLQRLARVPLAALVDRTGHNAHLAVLVGAEVIYLIEERAPGKPPLVTDVGVRLPAHLTATGRAMLAGFSRAQVSALYPSAGALIRRNAVGPQTVSALRTILVSVRRDGYASEDGEVTDDFSSVAAAVLDHNRHPVAAVAVTYPMRAATAPGVQAALAREVVRTADLLSRRIGGQPSGSAPSALPAR